LKRTSYYAIILLLFNILICYSPFLLTIISVGRTKCPFEPPCALLTIAFVQYVTVRRVSRSAGWTSTRGVEISVRLRRLYYIVPIYIYPQKRTQYCLFFYKYYVPTLLVAFRYRPRFCRSEITLPLCYPLTKPVILFYRSRGPGWTWPRYDLSIT